MEKAEIYFYEKGPLSGGQVFRMSYVLRTIDFVLYFSLPILRHAMLLLRNLKF